MEGREKDGRFVKGHKIGRKAGVPNKVNAEQRHRIDVFFQTHWDEFETDIWPKLSPREKKDTFVAMLNYGYPKLSSVDVKTDNKIESSILDEIKSKISECSII